MESEAEFRGAVRRLFDGGQTRLVLDLVSVPAIDRCGLGAMSTIRNSTSAKSIRERSTRLGRCHRTIARFLRRRSFRFSKRKMIADDGVSRGEGFDTYWKRS